MGPLSRRPTFPRAVAAAPAAFAVTVVAIVTNHSWAQPPDRGYAGAGVATVDVDSDVASGTMPAVTLVAGGYVRRWLAVEGELTLAQRTVPRRYGGDELSLSLAPAGGSPEERARLGVWLRHDNRYTLHAMGSGAVVLRYAVPQAQRVVVGALVGLSAQRVTERLSRTPVKLGPGVPTAHAAAQATSEGWRRTVVGPVFGAQLGLALGQHVSLMPDVRYHYGSIADELNSALQVSVRVVWRF